MKLGRTAALTAAALVLGLVVGNVAVGVAAPAAESTTTTTVAGMGLRLGVAMREAGARLADVVAKLTDQSVEDVTAERAKGTSFAAIAAAKGIEAPAVVSEALKIREQVLDQKVSEGRVTQEQADAALERMKTRITERVESTDASCDGAGGGRPADAGTGMGGGMGGGRGRGQGGMGGMGGGRGNGGVCTMTDTATQ